MSKLTALNWLITAAAGLAASLFSLRMGEVFARCSLPLFFPPVWLFPVGWTAVLICLVSAYLKTEHDKAKLGFYVSLGLVVLWAVLFFRMGLPLAAAIAGMTLTGVLLRLRRLAGVPGAGRRFLPCCVWTGYLTYLNLGIFILN
jgi:tryptophan-rich sensory protein